MTNPFGYAGKRVVITGAYSGLGAATVELLSGLGASEIIALDLKEPRGPISRFIQADLGDPAAVDAATHAVDGPIHVLFNNAGIAAASRPLDVMKVNYLGLRQLSESLLPKMPSGAAIANTASIAGGQWPQRLAQIQELLAITDRGKAVDWIEGHPELVNDGYAFSKECVQVYTMSSSKATMARGVRTNSICPAPIDTPLLPAFRESMGEKIIDWTVAQTFGKLASAEEVARALVFLGSDASGFVNGVNLIVDAGFTAFLTTGQIDLGSLPT